MAASTRSIPPSELARAARASTRASSVPGTARTLATLSAFWVSVPVLSTHSTSMVAASSTAVSRVGSTPILANTRAPRAAANVNVAGSATGMEPRTTASTSGTIPESRRRTTAA